MFSKVLASNVVQTLHAETPMLRLQAIIRTVLMLLLIWSATTASAEEFQHYSQEAIKKYLAKHAKIERKVHVQMRDGVHLSTDIYLPQSGNTSLGTLFVRTPYNFSKLRGSNLRLAAEAISRGYAFVIQNERGRYFSEGTFELLGYPRTDGYDALTWIAEQKWSNGKVGTIGCSSSAEWQLALAGENHPAHAAMVPMASGAGIGRIGEFQEQGNWYRGGVERMLFFPWLYAVDNPLRAQLPSGLDQKMRAHISQYNDLAAQKPAVAWKEQVMHLPVDEMLLDLGEYSGIFEQLISRTPANAAWFESGLYHDDKKWGVPALWFNSWYDVSIGPNMALFNHARKMGVNATVREHQYAVVAPVPHCKFWSLEPKTTVGAREMGDTSFDTANEIFGFFDRFLRDNEESFPDETPKVRYFAMGENDWKSSATWPPQSTKDMKFYLRSGGDANSMYGDGFLSFEAPRENEPRDSFTYDPMNPVQTIGGGDCCNGGTVIPGAFDQRKVEARRDVLVYTSEVLDEPLKITGFVDVVLNVSSDARDTDFAVKLVDVAPDGTAWIIDDTIFRARYREGYDKQVFMKAGEIYTIDFTPMTTSIVFKKGHRIRVEITSSNFPKFVRNLNTGGDTVSEHTSVRAQNSIHHDAAHPSYLILPIDK